MQNEVASAASLLRSPQVPVNLFTLFVDILHYKPVPKFNNQCGHYVYYINLCLNSKKKFIIIIF